MLGMLARGYDRRCALMPPTTPRRARTRPLLTLSIAPDERAGLEAIAARWGLPLARAVARLVKEETKRNERRDER
jgi:hypothetical protein